MTHRQSSTAARRAVLLIVSVATVAASSLAQEKTPVPPDAAREKALALVRDVFGDQWKAARTGGQKADLAKRLLAEADRAVDATNRYVLLRVARDVAADAGDGELASRAIDEMARRYDVDADKLKASALSRAAGSTALPKPLSTIAASALPLIDRAVERDDFAAAKHLCSLAADAARRARDYPLVKRIAARNKEVEAVAAAYAGVEKARATLETIPGDPEANLAVGRYSCFMKGDWPKGLPMLALGSDPTVKALAEKELRGVSSPNDKLALANGWWDLAEKQGETAKRHILAHAADWYKQALPELGGLVKARVDKRLEELAAEGIGATGERQASREIALFNGRDLTGWKYVPIAYSKSKTNKTWVVDARRKVLVSLGGDDNNDLATVGVYGDFKLSLEWRFRPGGALGPNGSGIVVRADGRDARKHNPKGIEIDLRPNKDVRAGIGTGCLIAYSTPARNHRGATDGEKRRQLGWIREPRLKDGGEWNECVITCEGEHLVVEMNGVVVNRASGIQIPEGHIYLRNQKTAVEFRNIRLENLAPAE